MANGVKALQLQHYGGSDALSIADVDIPIHADGEVLVRIELAGVNFIDIYMREGHYQKSSTYGSVLPFTLGMDCLLYTSPSPRDGLLSRMPSSA